MFKLAALVFAVSLSACVVPEGARPSTSLGLDVATHYMHRGMVQNEKGVAQTEVVVALPAKKDGTIIVRGFGNIDLKNDTGDAWLPDGHAGRFSQLDWNLLYEQVIDNFVLTFGLISYNLPNGLEFQFGERGATTEIMVEATTEIGPQLRPTLAIHYDFDEVEDIYIQAAVERTFELREDWSIDGALSIGFLGDDMAFWNYAMDPATSGLGDLVLSGDVTHVIDSNISAHLMLGLSTVLDSDYRDWFENDIGIDDTQVFLALGVEWSY